MKERDLNTIVSRTFKWEQYGDGKGQKIPDPLGGTGIQNVFDHFFITWEKTYYTESKLIKGEYSSFNFKKIEDHQYNNLIGIRDRTRNYKQYVENCIIVAWFIPRKLFEIVFIDINLIEYLKKQNKKSILKKELLQLKEKYFLPIYSIKHKNQRLKIFDYAKINILKIEDWKEVFDVKSN